MAQLPLPARGQPLDVSYLYTITEAINSVTQAISDSDVNYSSIATSGYPLTNLRTSDLKFCAGTIEILTNQQTSSVAVDTGYPFTWDYPGAINFKYPPIVTATVVNAGNTTLGSQAWVSLLNVNTDNCKGQVIFGKAGQATVTVNLIAIGLSAEISAL